MFLVLSVLSSTLIFITFKKFEDYGVNNFYAILTNYIIAGALGFYITGSELQLTEVVQHDWFPFAIFIGLLFIVLFQVMAATAQKLGVVTASVAVKMSAVLPVVAGVVLYNEPATITIIIGVVLALLAVYLTTKKGGGVKKLSSTILVLLPVILFFGDGTISILMKYAQYNWLATNEMAIFSGVVFGLAFCWGLIFLIPKLIKKDYPKPRDFLGGVLLGIPNFGSIYFLLEALDKSGMTSSAIYPINNVAIVSLSALVGVAFFKEKLSTINLIGLVCAISAIILIANG